MKQTMQILPSTKVEIYRNKIKDTFFPFVEAGLLSEDGLDVIASGTIASWLKNKAVSKVLFGEFKRN